MSRPAENVVSRHDADLTKAIYARVPVADRDRFADCPPGMGATPARSPQPRQSLGRYAMHFLSWRRGGLCIAPMSSACVHGSARVEELALPKCNNPAAEYVNSVMADLKPFWVIVLRQAV